MKKKLSLFIAFVLTISMFCGNILVFANTDSDTDSKYKDDVLYHHLDFCVYCAVQNSNGKWDGKAYGETVSLSLPITFGNKVEVQNAYFYTGKGNDAFTFDASKGDSWNVKVNDFKQYQNSPLPMWTSTNVSNISATVGSAGNDVTLSYNAKVDSAQKLNVVSGYNAIKENSTILTSYKKLVYTAWGGETGLSQQASVDEGARVINEALKKVFSGNSSIKELDLVFIPVVIEYRILKPEETTCTRCGKCLVEGDTVCTEESCEHFGTSECGCYEEPKPIISETHSNGACSTVSWNVTYHHRHTHRSCYTGADDKRHCHTVVDWEGDFTTTYTASVKISNAKLTADKPMKSHKGNEVTFKSGYGFYVTADVSASISGNGGCPYCGGKAPNNKTVSAPSKSYLQTNWTVKGSDKKKKYTQPKVIELTVANGKVTTPVNQISNYGKKLIYTDVELKGTKKNPVKHTVTLYAKAYLSTGEEVCASVPLTFWIKGNMYEDDYTVEAR